MIITVWLPQRVPYGGASSSVDNEVSSALTWRRTEYRTWSIEACLWWIIAQSSYVWRVLLVMPLIPLSQASPLTYHVNWSSHVQAHINLHWYRRHSRVSIDLIPRIIKNQLRVGSNSGEVTIELSDVVICTKWLVDTIVIFNWISRILKLKVDR